MGKQDLSCQMWLEQGGGGREGIVCPLAICPPPPPPFPPCQTPSPPPPQERYRGDPRLQPPLLGVWGGEREEEG